MQIRKDGHPRDRIDEKNDER